MHMAMELQALKKRVQEHEDLRYNARVTTLRIHDYGCSRHILLHMCINNGNWTQRYMRLHAAVSPHQAYANEIVQQ